MKVGILIMDCEDGSASLHYYRDLYKAERLLNDGDCNYLNDGILEVIEVQEDFNPPGGWSD